MTLRGQQLTLSCVGKRVKLILEIPDYFKEVFETWEFCGATLTYSRHSKRFWVRLVFESDNLKKLAGLFKGLTEDFTIKQ
jgi:putative transposase